MELNEITTRARSARESGAEVVAVLGLGFVGSAAAAALSLARTPRGPRWFVVGIERDAPDGLAKIAALEAGRAPTTSDDGALGAAFASAAHEPRRVVATTDRRALALADVVVACINLDLVRASGQTEELDCPTRAYAELVREVGRRARAGALLFVESTLPLGLSERVLYPALVAGAREAGRDVERDPPLYAYGYERVTPGPSYLESVLRGPRAFAGVDERSAARAREFLASFLHVGPEGLWRHKSLRACELAKLLENAYRATNIAFVDEWARLAEDAGIDLYDVVRSIRVRRGTHDNLMSPGLGVGGYCLTKDALLAAWGARELLDVPAELPFSRAAVLTNERMPLRAARWIEEALGERLAGATVALFGLTYRSGVADTRSSPSETLARELLRRRARVRAWDPLLARWDEVPEAATCASAREALVGASAAVVCLPDPRLRAELASALPDALAPGALVVDAWDVLGDDCARDLAARGIRVRVYGRGDVPAPGSVAP